ncbi:MAG: glutathione S-transferase family protein [Sphingomonadales bacterium]|nr:MAG: glutathione S-transferase family protein [Sphingomonadales bacterium]
MLIVHHLGVSQSDRIVWLCEELELPYELRRYDRDPVTMAAPPEYKALHPFGTAPVITDGDLVLGESTAIVEYLCRTYAGGRLLVGPDDPEYANFLFWFHFANGSILPAVMMEMAAVMFGVEPAKAAAHPAGSSRTDKAYAMADIRLGEADYFAGDALSAADIMMVFTLTTMRRFAARDIAPYPNIHTYLKRIGARAAYRRAMEKADPGVPLMLD